MQLELRDYQREATAAVRDAWRRGISRAAVELPTGSGKTVIFAEMARDAHARGERPVVLVHRDELVRQAADKLHSAMPDAIVGKIQAEHNAVDADVLVASVPTLARERRRNQLTNVGTVVVDEAHHAMAPTYRTILHHFGSFNGLPTSGWSATLSRGDGKGLGDVWEEIVYEKDILWMIKHGYLVDVKGKKITVDGLNLAEVARTRGDMQEGDLGRKMLSVGAGEHIAKGYLEHAKGRRGVLFAPTVESADSFAQSMNDAGIPTETIFGYTDLETRQDTYARFRTGETQVLSNCMVLTEGWDAPWAEVAVIARPTESVGLYVQMAGRVLRPWPGKANALILDVVGVTGKHRLASIQNMSKTKVEEGETLKEAEQREQKERHAGWTGEAEGERVAAEVDLFGQSRSAWLQTYAKVWFIPTREHVFLLWPTKTGHFDVGRCSTKTTADGIWLAKGVTLEYGMAWAEQEALKEDKSVSQRTAPWRVRKQPPSEAQLGVAARARIPVTSDDTKATVSDKLSVHFTSRLIDPKPRRR
jgi:superfamily II DNA or RNA helicase